MGPDQKKIDALARKMIELDIKKQDLEEKFIKSSGRGGQKVNKTSSAVFIRHTPTGLAVKFGKHRSQNLNRFMALRHLVEKIEARMTGKEDKPARKARKISKQKRRRKARTRKKLSGKPLSTGE